MGMYTELVLGVKIASNEDVIAALRYMLGDVNCFTGDHSHELFDSDRWGSMLRCDSYYFDGQTDSKLFEEDEWGGKIYYLNVRTNLKNYDNEIEKFLDWLKPYIETDGFIGYKRYEEDEDPTLIYKDNTYNTIDYVKVTR